VSEYRNQIGTTVDAAELERLKHFGAALNDMGLSSDAAMASEFGDLRGRQIPSHAPFEVVGILVHDPLKD
jgi:hypothetical protein